MITAEKIKAIIISLCIVALGSGAVLYCTLPSAKNEEISNIEAISAQVQYDLGARYVDDGNYQESVIAFEAAIDLNPKMTEAYVALADVYVAQAQPEEAVDVLEEAIVLFEAAAKEPTQETDVDTADKADDGATEDAEKQDKDVLLDKLEEVEEEIQQDFGTDYEIVWVEPFVEQSVRTMLDKPEGVIMRSELDDISALYVYGEAYFSTEPLTFDAFSAQNYEIDGVWYDCGTISSLADFAHFKGLKSLAVRWNAVDDLSPLASLTRLRTLDLYSNQIGDLSTFEEIPEEDILDDLESSILEDLDTLVELVNDGVTGFDLFLEMLNFKTVALWSKQAGGLSGLAESEWLPIDDAQRNQLSAFAKLADFGLFGNMSETSVAEEPLPPAVALVYLRNVDLSYNNIIDLNALVGLSKLETLTLDHNDITDLSPLVAIATLQTLSLSDNQITVLSPLAQLVNLQCLNLIHNSGITDWSPVAAIEVVEGRPSDVNAESSSDVVDDQLVEEETENVQTSEIGQAEQN